MPAAALPIAVGTAANLQSVAMTTIARFSLAEYDRIVGSGALDRRRLELARGEILEMAPIGPDHEHVVDLLAEWTTDTVPREAIRLRVQQSIALPDLSSAPQPDIAWVARRNYRAARPTAADCLLLIEVSGSSLAYDRCEKAALYADAGIADYWIVNLRDRQIEVHRGPQPAGYASVTIYRGEEEVRSLAFPEVGLRPSTLWD